MVSGARGGSRWTSAHPLETGTSVGVPRRVYLQPRTFLQPRTQLQRLFAAAGRPASRAGVQRLNTGSETRQVSHHGDSIPEPTVTSGVDRHKRFHRPDSAPGVVRTPENEVAHASCTVPDRRPLQQPVLIAAPAYAQGPANDGDSRAAGDVPAAADNPGAYGKNDAGGFRNVLPPGQNGLDTLGQILNFRATAPAQALGRPATAL